MVLELEYMNFSAMGFIHSKLRNTLSPSSVEKLVYIKTNLNTFNDLDTPADDEIRMDDNTDSDSD
jgi:hypothetical protein